MANIVGTTLLNRFRVDAFIASGGMSVVYRVWDLERSVPLAMKVLHADLADDPSIIKRFQREARALRKLAHPNIVPFYGLYQAGDLTFLVEQYIDGPTLKEILKKQRGQGMQVGEALTYMKALCNAVSYAHNNGVVHCDIKPGNVMIDRSGNIFLADFGVARHADSTTTTLGGAGTPAYMAPEQIRGEAVTPATDVYALGVVLYELLTGQRPFAGSETSSDNASGTAAERVRLAHLTLQPPNPMQVNPKIPEGLASVAIIALSKNPQERYQTALDMLNAACSALGTTPQRIPNRVAPPEMEPEVDFSAPPALASQPSAAFAPAPTAYAPAPSAGYAPAASVPAEYTPDYPAAAAAPLWRSPWIWAAGAALLILVCGGVGLFAGLPMIKSFLATPTRPSTSIPSETSLPPGAQTFSATKTPLPTYTLPATYTPPPTYTAPAPDQGGPASTAPPSNAVHFSIVATDRSAYFVYVAGKYVGVVGGSPVEWAVPSPGVYEFRLCLYVGGSAPDISKCQPYQKNISGDGVVIGIPEDH